MNQNVLLIDSSVEQHELLQNACNENTVGIVYSSSDSIESILNKIKNYGSVKRIALAFHYSPNYIFLEGKDIFSSDCISFFITLGKEVHVEHIDFLACNTLKDPNWCNFYETIKRETSIIVGASNNPTGNIQYGGDWIMENTSEDVEKIYFTSDIKYYTYLLGFSSFSYIMSGTDIYNVGNNLNGQLGRGFDGICSTLIEMIAITGKTPSQIACGSTFTIVLMTDGTVYGTGFNGSGQLGLGNTTDQFSLTPMILPSGKTPSQIACGDSFTIVLMTDGTVYGTGLNSFGQLGLGNTTDQFSLTQMILPSGKTPSQIACGGSFTIVCMTDGTVYGTGQNSYGQLGLGNTTDQFSLTQMILPSGKTPSKIACGTNFTIVRMSDGTVYGTGENYYGQLGLGNTTQQTYLTQMIRPSGKTPSQIACGSNFTIVRMTDGTVYGTGSNTNGQLGLGDTTQRTSLTQMTIPSGKTPSQIACGGSFTIVRMTDGTVYGTGQNTNGQIGSGINTTSQTVLTQSKYAENTFATNVTYLMNTLVESQTETVITVDSSFNKVYGNEPFNLNVLSNSPATINYVSSNPLVAIVDSMGFVNVVGEGVSIITISQDETDEYTSGLTSSTINVSQNTIDNPALIANSEQLQYYLSTNANYGEVINNLYISFDLINESQTVKYIVNGISNNINISRYQPV